LDFKVKRVTAADVRAIESGLRPGETLQRLIHNYLEFETETTRRQPLILVVNPDIFYYALYFRYGAHDRRNIFERFLTAFDYIVIDEFHYYDYKQLANFLFAFALFDQFGYFAVRNRKVCLLSATPTTPVIDYLDRLFGARWTRIGPDNEPTESQTLPLTPALTPLSLQILDSDLMDYITTQHKQIVQWVVRDSLDGALISSSLASVNGAYARLRVVLDEKRMGRITGPEPQAERMEATARDLILATPTVDIGYNFVKKGKQRQNVDFLICDALYGDELLQRIGRAGRVLGKAEATIPSYALALLSTEAAQALQAYDGQTLTRAEFAQIVQRCPELPPKHSLTGYIRTYAITECFWPIFQLGKMMPDDLAEELEALFKRVCDLFAPASQQRMTKLKNFFRKLESRERWLTESRKQISFNRDTAQQVADWLAWLESTQGQIEPHRLQPHLDTLLADDEQQNGLRDFVSSQVEITRALFSFRDAFQGPTAVIFDPQRNFSSQVVNRYDLFHLLRNYRLSPSMSRQQFEQQCQQTDLQGDFYLALQGELDEKLVLELVYQSQEDRSEFERKWCGRPVALRGIRLQARKAGGDVLAGQLYHEMITTLVDRYLPVLIIPPEDVGAMIARLRGSNLWAQRLTLRFPTGEQNEHYRVLVGSAAFHAHAELRGHFLLKERLKSDAIIL
jgi:CRISPR-associated endonuclease/helicase Cas3